MFIDGVLVGDLGGIHDAASLNINFRTGEVTVSVANNSQTQETTSLHEAYEAAGKTDSTTWRTIHNGWNSYTTFADDTYHTLDFFYLERGLGASNMSLKYNLVTIPQTDIQKVDQEGDPVADATFKVEVADKNYDVVSGIDDVITSATTDSQGNVVLLDGQGKPITLDSLWTRYSRDHAYYDEADGGSEEQAANRLNLLLTETDTPSGYRSGGPYRIYLWHTTSPVSKAESTLLLADVSVESSGSETSASDGSTWKSGIFSDPKVATTAADTITYNQENWWGGTSRETVSTAETLGPDGGGFCSRSSSRRTARVNGMPYTAIL